MSCPSPCLGCSKTRILLTLDGVDATVLTMAAVALFAFLLSGYDGLRQATVLLGSCLALRGFIRAKEFGCCFAWVRGTRSMLCGGFIVIMSSLLDGAVVIQENLP